MNFPGDMELNPAEALEAINMDLGSADAALAPPPEMPVADPVLPRKAAPPPPVKTQRFDFRQAGGLSLRLTRQLGQHHKEFARSLSDRLTLYLRQDFQIQFTTITAVSYQKLVDMLASPTHLTLFKLEPLRGINLLDLPTRLGLNICDRMMGGTAQSANADRAPTEIEVALLDQVVQMILDEWCGLWREWQELKTSLLGHETDARYLQTSPMDVRVLCVEFEGRLGEVTSPMRMAFPLHTLEPLFRWIAPPGDAPTPEKPADVPKPPTLTWNPVMDEIPIKLQVGWEGLEMTGRSLTSLKVGDILEIPQQHANSVQVRIGGKAKFMGRLGTCGKNWAVELTQTSKT